jgi:hypothetical protein
LVKTKPTSPDNFPGAAAAAAVERRENVCGVAPTKVASNPGAYARLRIRDFLERPAVADDRGAAFRQQPRKHTVAQPMPIKTISFIRMLAKLTFTDS